MKISWITAHVGLFCFAISSSVRAQQIFPPGTFAVDGIPVACGSITFVVDPYLPDVGMASPGVIHLNSSILSRLVTPMKLFWVAHECGHHFVGTNESAADCWAIRTGRQQGWFPPSAFNNLMFMFQNNQGDISHPPGPLRVQQMMQCYAVP